MVLPRGFRSPEQPASRLLLQLQRATHLLGLLVVCFTIWQKTSSRSSSGACRHVLSTFSACPASSLLLLRSPMKPVTLRNSCTAVASSSLVGILRRAFLITSFFQESTLDTVVRAPKKPLRFSSKLASARGKRRGHGQGQGKLC